MAGIDLWQGILNGFASGIGVGLSNWLLIKRLEKMELKLLKRRNGKP